MTSLDSPAIGRKIVYLMHHDRTGLIVILAGTLPSCWPDLAGAYLQALGQTEATERQATIPGVLFVWQQLIKESHPNAHRTTPWQPHLHSDILDDPAR